jgi:hypothetical protein
MLISCALAALNTGMRVSPAFERNKGPILEALTRHLPSPAGHILEVASGPGAHTAHWASELPQWTFQPTDVDAGQYCCTPLQFMSNSLPG